MEKYKIIFEKLREEEKKYIYFSQYIQIAENALYEGDVNIANNYYNIARKYKKMSFKQIIRKYLLYCRFFKNKIFN